MQQALGAWAGPLPTWALASGPPQAPHLTRILSCCLEPPQTPCLEPRFPQAGEGVGTPGRGGWSASPLGVTVTVTRAVLARQAPAPGPHPPAPRAQTDFRSQERLTDQGGPRERATS